MVPFLFTNGDILPIYSVGRVNLEVNGRVEVVEFYSTDIHPYDVILGEDWLHHNRTILDTPHTNHDVGSFVVGSTDTLGSALDRRVRAAQCTDRAQDLHRKSMGSRTGRTELRVTVRQTLGVITGYADKCFPEDNELVIEDIPGLNLPSPSPTQQGSAPPSAFSFIESEVHTHVDHMSRGGHSTVADL
jgi:hypothetical protein